MTHYAWKSERLAAVLVDHIILAIITFLLYLAELGGDPTSLLKSAPALVLVALGLGYLYGLEGIGIFLLFFLPPLLYFSFFESITGQTPGKRMQHIKVVDETTQKQISLEQALTRNLLRTIDLLPVFYILGFILTSTDERRRRLGDRAARTVVLREPR